MLRNVSSLAALGALLLAACGGGSSTPDVPAVDPNVSWVRTAPGTGEGGWGQSVARFADDSMVVVGNFDATLTFGAGLANETVLTAVGPFDAFVARYNADGSFVWAVQIESPSGVYPKDVDVLADGSVAVAGWFKDSVTLAPGEVNEVTYPGTTASWQTTFVARYTGAGDLVWSRAIGGDNGDVTTQKVTGTTDGNVVIAGYANAPSIVFGAGEPNETTATLFKIESVVAKFDGPTGNLVWVRTSESSSGTSAWGLDKMPGGGVAVFGRFRGTTDFDGVSASATPNSRDNWIVTYDADGKAQWARVIGVEYTENPYALATSPTGMIVVTGEYQETTQAGAESGAPQSISSPLIARSMYVAVYDAAGNFQWLRGSQAATNESNGQDVAFFPDGGVLVSTYFRNEITLGLGEVTQTTLTTPVTGIGNAALARYTPAGLLDWAKQISDGEESGAMGVATLSDNSFVAAGYFLSTATWGAGDPNQTVLSTTTNYEMFLARYNPDGGF